MHKLRHIFVLIVFALAKSPSWGAVQIEEKVSYLQGVQSDSPDCTWEPSIATAAITNAQGALTSAAKAATGTGPKLSLQVIKLGNIPKKTGYTVSIRADVTEDGKLLATRDFNGEGTFKDKPSACPALNKIGTAIGESMGEWMSQTHLMTCGEGCTGIHPDDTIVVGAEVLVGNPDAINDTVRNDCHFQTALVTKLVEAFNEGDTPPRAKLESRGIDIEKYTGRRLILRVDDVHALGGGGYTGPKWMDMSGELREGNVLVGSFHSHTNSGRGLTTCRSLDSLNDSTVDMIVQWLNSPSIDAKLN
ncbi:MAG: hypothetical protein QM749_16190 [Aquabacterium sp.]